MPFSSLAYAEDQAIGKEEIKLEEAPGPDNAEKTVSDKQEIRLKLPARAYPEEEAIQAKEETSQTKEETPQAEEEALRVKEEAAQTIEKPAAAEKTADPYQPIVDKLMSIIQGEGIKLGAETKTENEAPQKTEEKPVVIEKPAVEKKPPVEVKPVVEIKPAAKTKRISKARRGTEVTPLVRIKPIVEEKPVVQKKPVVEKKPAVVKRPDVGGKPAATPFVKMIDVMVSGSQDMTSSLAKEIACISTVGTWDDMKRKKPAFSPEVGLTNIKASKEEKPPQVLTLKECIDIGIKNHLPLQTAKKSVRLAEIRVFEARRNLLPSASMTMEESTGRVNSRAYMSKKTYFEGQQPIYHGGELYYNLKQTQANLEITKSDYNRIRNELVLQVKKAYYSMAKAKENLRIQQETSAEVFKIDESVKKQQEANLTAKLEFLNVSSQVSQVKYQLASAVGDLSVAELILKQAMNIDTKDRIDAAALPPFKKTEIDFETALYAAMLNRPEMRINSLMIDYYNYGKGIARAKGLPKIDILGQWGMTKDEYTSLDSDYQGGQGHPSDDRKMEQQWYAGVKASMPLWGSTTEYSWTREQWPPQVSVYSATSSDTHSIKLKLFDKLDYYSDKKLAEIDYDKARQELIKIKQDITLEIREGCFNYEKAIIQLDTASSKVEYQGKDLEVTRFKREIDESADSSVIESMIKLAQEKFGYAQALADCRISLATINKAVGLEDYYKDE